MDVIAIHQAGFDNAVATLGTALTEEQARLISQYAERVVLAYDSCLLYTSTCVLLEMQMDYSFYGKVNYLLLKENECHCYFALK